MPLASHSSSSGLWVRFYTRQALPVQPYPERDRHRTRQAKPGDGVLQVIVLEMDLQRAGFWDAACGHRLLEIDIKRRDLTPAERAGHGEMIAGEPQPFRHVFRRRQRTRGFR